MSEIQVIFGLAGAVVLAGAYGLGRLQASSDVEKIFNRGYALGQKHGREAAAAEH